MIDENAKIWIGKEVEGKCRDARLFIGEGATYDDIITQLTLHDEVRACYFGNPIDWKLVDRLHQRVRCVVEVKNPNDVPPSLCGFIDVIVTLPNFVTAVKQIRQQTVTVTDLTHPTNNQWSNPWNGRKMYPDDECLV